MNLGTLFRTKSIEQIQSDAASGLHDGEAKVSGLRRELNVTDLTLLGVAAVVGAGIFSTIGGAAASGGPAVSMLFVMTAVACAFAAFCYAEFASMIPVAGSAYTYAYASFGELLAWIIGWDLLMEYCIGNIAVAISWSDYFTSLLSGYGVTFPEYLSMDFYSAHNAFNEVTKLLQSGNTLDQIRAMAGMGGAVDGYMAWSKAPIVAGLHIVCDLPALFITFIITWLVYVGIKESKNVSNAMVVLKLGIILLVIAVGAFFINTDNWDPFAPNGIKGVLAGVSGVFFAYIGFDAISTTAEECKNPQRDLPRGMMYALIICTVLYVLIALVLTGMVNYKNLAVGDPMAYVFGPDGANIKWIKGVIAISAVIAMSTVLLVFQLGQPRIWMSMSRDGLLPKIFSSIHPKYKTPWFSTIVTGFVVAIPSLFMNLKEVTDLTSIGTLFAFVLVCGGVLVLQNSKQKIERKFKTPYISSKYIIPVLFITAWSVALWKYPAAVKTFFTLGDWEIDKHKIPMFLFVILSFVLTIYSFLRNLSLIPVLGLLTCGYLMTELGWTNWARFLIWLLIGLVVYFIYGFQNSKLKKLR